MADAPITREAPGVFASVHFKIVISNDLSHQEAETLQKVLLAHGATEHSPPSPRGDCDLTGLTHIVAATIDFDGYEAADDRMIPVVNRSWIDTSIAKKRLANPKSHSPDPRMFFSGLVVCTADLPEGDKDAIIGGVLAMGGLYSGSISKLVTHVVALNMEPVVCQTVQTKGFKCKIVLPQWFDDCFRLGKRIDEAPYQLPDPAILKDSNSTVVGVSRLDLNGATSHESITMEVPSSAEEPADDLIFSDKSFFLAGDLAITEHLRSSIVDVITSGGGVVCDTVEDCNVCVCHYRHGHGYEQAYKDKKIIGNLPWLYWMVGHNRWTSPMKRLLHYPIPLEGLAGMQTFRLCLSNYSGEARIYLESLAKAAGCEFTKTLKNDNTHLITAHTLSEKCDAAKEWGIFLVNHLWLEESYAKCHVQSATLARYTHFPPRTNLTEVVGQTSIDRNALDQQFRGGQVPPEPSPEKASQSVYGTPSSPVKVLSQRNKVEQVDKDRRMATPVAKPKMAGKENETPPTIARGSRGAKDKATARLQDLAPDIALYEKEAKRKGGVIYGGRRKSSEDGREDTRKRSFSDAHISDHDDNNTVSTKKVKPTTTPARYRMLVTGLPEYTGQDKKAIKKRDKLRALGVLITESEHNCKYLVAPKILRTRKFVCAVAQAPILVHEQYLEACIDQEELLDPEEFPLTDAQGEKHYKLKMAEVMHRARSNRGKMFKGWTVWATKDVHGGLEAYQSIMEANGGRCLLFQGRPGSIPQANADSDSESEDEAERETPAAFLLSGTTETEQHLWPRFHQMATQAGMRPHIVRNDWLLDAALKQEPRFQAKYIHETSDLDVTA